MNENKTINNIKINEITIKTEGIELATGCAFVTIAAAVLLPLPLLNTFFFSTQTMKLNKKLTKRLLTRKI